MVFFISELDIKQLLDRPEHKPGKFLTGVIYRYQIPAQSLNCWQSVGIIGTCLCLCKCSPWSLELSGISLNLGNRQQQVQQDGSRGASPGRAPAAPLKLCNSLCCTESASELWSPTYGGHKRGQTTCINCARDSSQTVKNIGKSKMENWLVSIPDVLEKWSWLEMRNCWQPSLFTNSQLPLSPSLHWCQWNRVFFGKAAAPWCARPLSLSLMASLFHVGPSVNPQVKQDSVRLNEII